MSELIQHHQSAVSIVDSVGPLHSLEMVSRSFEQHTHSESTRRAYDGGWRTFTTFCANNGLAPLPASPETVRWFVASMAAPPHREPYAVSTIRQRLASISDRHLRSGYLDPTGHIGVVNLLRGFQKQSSRRPLRKTPLLLDDVVKIVRSMDHRAFPAGISAARDTLALWLGFAGALRRSEAAGLLMSSVQLHHSDGVHVHVGKSKTDQENQRADVVVLPYGSRPVSCAPCALHRWVALTKTYAEGSTSRITDMDRMLRETRWLGHVCGRPGSKREPLISNADLSSGLPLLRAVYRNRHSITVHRTGISGDALHAMLLTRMTEAKMSSDGYGYHSLRAGHVTQARRNGAPTEEIMRAGRWRNHDTVNIYDREHNPAARNSVMRLGL
ncbi:phage integrase family protein [Leucobacter luti]|uniref:Phage integrase family protein n=1 Tax=Leucobacter luti TaxID=340320 RepID=A0A4R6S1B7_9MICO|nr:tyrosine-type recombinase/integrase [Leucobacter luti]TDP92426.1 phage integrase family protein [Leucobacter luti]